MCALSKINNCLMFSDRLLPAAAAPTQGKIEKIPLPLKPTDKENKPSADTQPKSCSVAPASSRPLYGQPPGASKSGPSVTKKVRLADTTGAGSDGSDAKSVDCVTDDAAASNAQSRPVGRKSYRDGSKVKVVNTKDAVCAQQ